MRPLSDTSAEAQRVLSDAYRAMSPARKLRLLEEAYRLARSLHGAGLRHRGVRDEPGETWNALVLGRGLWDSIKGSTIVDQEAERLAVLQEVVTAFEKLGIAYAVGGSWASSVHGEPRLTLDADVSVEPFPGHEKALAACFGTDYYVECQRDLGGRPAPVDVQHHSRPVGVQGRRLRPQERRLRTLDDVAPVARGRGRRGRHWSWSPPRTSSCSNCAGIRLGNEVSERQWLDVLGVIRTQAGGLDTAYLDHWAADLGVRDLWDRGTRGSAADEVGSKRDRPGDRRRACHGLELAFGAVLPVEQDRVDRRG